MDLKLKKTHKYITIIINYFLLLKFKIQSLRNNISDVSLFFSFVLKLKTGKIVTIYVPLICKMLARAKRECNLYKTKTTIEDKDLYKKNIQNPAIG